MAEGSLTAPIGAGITTAPIAAPDPGQLTPDLARLRKMFDDSRQTNSDAREQSGIDRDYYDGHQLTATQRQTLQARKQPDIVINRVRRGVDGIMGVVEQGRTDPRAFMRNPPDNKPPQQMQPQGGMAGPMGMMGGQQQPQQQAPKPDLDAGDVATMTLRYIADVSQFQATKMDALETMLVEGVGAVVVEVDQANDNEVSINPILWEEFFYDPRSRRADFKDARYMGVGKWMYADILAASYPERAQAIQDYATGSGSGMSPFDQSWEDKPDNASPWVDTKQHRLMVVEIYYIQNARWMRCVFCASDILEIGPSPYKDDRGQTKCPIEAQSCYVDRQNRRYGVVRDMRGPQDEINNRRSRALFEINSRQVQQVDPNGPPIDMELVRAEAARPDGVLPPNAQVIPRQDIIANNLLLLQEAKSEIERMGPNPAILGRQGADASGRAQQIRQQAGLTELARVLGRFKDWEERVYKAAWNCARQFYTDPKWIRVTDDIGAPQYVRINDPVMQMGMDLATGQPVPQVVDMKNHIAKMDVDIIVDSVPDTATLQQEIFADMMQLAQAYGPQNVPFKIILELSPLPKRYEIIKRLEAVMAEQAQSMMQNPMAQLEHAEKRTGVLKTASEIEKNRAQTKKLDVEATTEAMHGVADARGYESGMPPPGTPKGALNGTEPPQGFQGPPPG